MPKNLHYYIVLGLISLVLTITAFRLTNKNSESSVDSDNLGNENFDAPGNHFDLRYWKLTLPINSKEIDGNPDEIEYPELKNFSHKYFFYDKDKKAIIFVAPTEGEETDNTKYTRSELREKAKDGDWNSNEGFHSMEIVQAVTNLPKEKPHVVIGQIHDDDDDVYVFRLEGQKLYANADDDDDDITLTENYNLGDKFKVKFEVENNKTSIFYNDKLMHTMKREYKEAYFKAGAYVQASCNYSSGEDYEKEDCSNGEIPYAEVEIYGLKVCHDSECVN